MDTYDVIVSAPAAAAASSPRASAKIRPARCFFSTPVPTFRTRSRCRRSSPSAANISWRVSGIPEFDWNFDDRDRAGAARRPGDPPAARPPRRRHLHGQFDHRRPSARRSISTAGRRSVSGLGLGDLLPYFVRIETDLDFGEEPIHGRRAGRSSFSRYRPRMPGLLSTASSRAPATNSACARRATSTASTAIPASSARCRTTASRKSASARSSPTSARPRGARTSRSARLPSSIACSRRGARHRRRLLGPQRSAAGARSGRARHRRPASTTRPAILQRSGVGPAACLRPLGIRGRRSPRRSAAICRPSRLRLLLQGRRRRRHHRPVLRRRTGAARRWRTANLVADPSLPGRRGRGHLRALDLSHAARRRRAKCRSRAPTRELAPLIDHRYQYAERGDQDRFDNALGVVQAHACHCARSSAQRQMHPPIPKADAMPDRSDGARPPPGRHRPHGAGPSGRPWSWRPTFASTASTICGRRHLASSPTTSCTTPISPRWWLGKWRPGSSPGPIWGAEFRGRRRGAKSWQRLNPFRRLGAKTCHSLGAVAGGSHGPPRARTRPN